MAVSTIKFSQFANSGNLVAGKTVIGLDTGANAQFTTTPQIYPPFTNSTQPMSPPIGGIGYNTTIMLFQFWNGTAWVNLSASSSSGTIVSGLANQLAYYNTTGTTLSGLTSGNNGVLVTSNTGAPSISSTLPSVVQDDITRLGTVVSGVWEGTAIVGSNIATDTITNSNLATMPANTVKMNNIGTTAEPIDGTVSELISMIGFFPVTYISQNRPVVSQLNLPHGTAVNILSQVLPINTVWKASGNIYANCTGTQNLFLAWINITSITIPDVSNVSETTSAGGAGAAGNAALVVPTQIITVGASPVTVYLSCAISLVTGTAGGSGNLLCEQVG